MGEKPAKPTYTFSLTFYPLLIAYYWFICWRDGKEPYDIMILMIIWMMIHSISRVYDLRTYWKISVQEYRRRELELSEAKKRAKEEFRRSVRS